VSERVTAFSTTRHGGVSTGYYASLNVNAYCGDTPEHIAENRRLLCQTLSISAASHLVMPHQVHGIEVRQINADFFSLTDDDRQAFLEGVDAVMTDMKEVCIGVSTADCIPVLIYDAEQHCACAIHAGWRGTRARIVEKAVAAMTKTYGCRSENLSAVIGPGISVENFEVGQEVYDAFCQEDFPMAEIAVMRKKWHINLPLCNRLQLQTMGVPSNQIQDAGICTFANADDFFSARRLGIQSGRILTGIVLH
jgi:hypothetical protein